MSDNNLRLDVLEDLVGEIDERMEKIHGKCDGPDSGEGCPSRGGSRKKRRKRKSRKRNKRRKSRRRKRKSRRRKRKTRR